MILRKIENFLIAIPMLLGIFHSSSGISSPKKKDYLGRIILSLAGLFIVLIVLVFIFLLVV